MAPVVYQSRAVNRLSLKRGIGRSENPRRCRSLARS